jgi:1,4-alpha-glucan branching enzyme
MLAGTFNDWKPDALAMKKVDSGWIAVVKLDPGKHYYKFIVDDKWTIDKDNELFENDGEGNDNSVYYKTNYVFTLAGYTNAKKVIVSGSFNNWDENALKLERWGQGWLKHIYLAEGTHTYRFIADGKWFADPANTEQYPNEFGETNSVVCMGKPHVFFLKGNLNAKKVMLMGSFNQWRNYELPMQKTDSGWIFPYVLGHGNYEYTFEVDGRKPVDAVTGKEKPNETLILSPNYTFRLKGYANAKRICVAGSFNNWSPGSFAMHKEGDEWVIEQHLAPGKHVYKFVVDGKWIVDPANELREPNEFGEENSVMWMRE